jgi:hypothetical protein
VIELIEYDVEKWIKITNAFEDKKQHPLQLITLEKYLQMNLLH